MTLSILIESKSIELGTDEDQSDGDRCLEARGFRNNEDYIHFLLKSTESTLCTLWRKPGREGARMGKKVHAWMVSYRILSE